MEHLSGNKRLEPRIHFTGFVTVIMFCVTLTVSHLPRGSSDGGGVWGMMTRKWQISRSSQKIYISGSQTKYQNHVRFFFFVVCPFRLDAKQCTLMKDGRFGFVEKLKNCRDGCSNCASCSRIKFLFVFKLLAVLFVCLLMQIPLFIHWFEWFSVVMLAICFKTPLTTPSCGLTSSLLEFHSGE